jgi:hypothetical protein|tara:strand:- start:1554 stop:1739 length:186 start_codon:yes stop_codon:yes gene_type:complete
MIQKCENCGGDFEDFNDSNYEYEDFCSRNCFYIAMLDTDQDQFFNFERYCNEPETDEKEDM